MEKINIQELIKFYISKWKFLLLVIVLSGVLGYSYVSFAQKPLYRSNSRLLFIEKVNNSTDKEPIIISLVELFDSKKILNRGVQLSGIDLGDQQIQQLTKNITVNSKKESNVINLGVEYKDPAGSQNLNQGIVKSFIEFFNSNYKARGEIKVIDSADLSSAPINIKSKRSMALFVGGGFMFYILALFMIYDEDANSKPNKGGVKYAKKK